MLAGDASGLVSAFVATAGGDLSLSLKRNLAADDVEISFEVSADLIDWEGVANPQLVSSGYDGGGFQTETWMIAGEQMHRRFVRVKVTLIK